MGLGPNIKMAGKTGTAQAFSYNGGKGAHGAVGEWKLRDHAWFIAYAPVDNPRYAVSVLVEHGGFGAQAAAPRARDIMRVALLKDPEIRAQIEKPLPLPSIPQDELNHNDLPEDPGVTQNLTPPPATATPT
jgi:penicillin-binding protein 2